MIKLISILLLIAAVIAAGQYYNYRQSAIEPSGKVLKIGFVGKFGGTDNAQGRETLEGVLAANRLQPLLVNGHELVIVAEEQGETAEETLTRIEKLVNEDKVEAILIGSASEHMLKVKQVADVWKIPVISLIATHPEVTTGSSYMNQLCFDDTMQGKVAALFVRDELLLNRVAVIIDQSDPYSSYLGQIFRTKFESTNGVLTGFNTVSQLKSSLLHELEKADTQLLYLPLNPQANLKIIELLAEHNWKPKLMGSDGLLANVLTRYPEQVDKFQGFYVTELFSGQDEFTVKRLLAKRALKAFKSLFRGEGTTYTALGVEGYMILRKAMNSCGELQSSNCINNNIRSTDNFKGLMANISIGKDGKAKRPVYVNIIDKGELDSVVKVY